jgi:AraC-like DNA-binding protein
MLNSILPWLFLLAIGQALLLSVALLSIGQPDMRTANRLLSLLLLIFSAIIGHAWLGLNNLYQQYPHSALAIITLGLAVGPLLYLYLIAMLSDQPLGRRALLHFLPFAIATVAMTPFYLRSAGEKLVWMQQLNATMWYLSLAAAVKTIFFLLYIHASYRLMQRVPPDSDLTRGLRRLMQIWVVGGLLSIAALGVELTNGALPLSADAVGGLALILFVFATAFLAMRLPLGYRPQTLPPAAPKQRYANNRLSETDAATFLSRLTACMELDQVFRHGELKLEELAKMAALTPHELSQLINESCRTNFSDYVNRYRVEELKRALHDPDRNQASILDLALASGFNSKSAMNRVFKQQTGMTPGEFRSRAGRAIAG